MSSLPLVWCFSYSSPPKPAYPVITQLYAEHFMGDFILLDQVSITDLSENQRENVRGILCTGGYAQSKIKLDKGILDLLPNVKVISTPSTGVNHIDVEAATTRGIRVGHSPGHFPSDSVAEFAFGLLLASARSIIAADKVAKSSDFTSLHLSHLSQLIPPGQQVTGSTIGIVGLGNIGRALAERAKGFKMNILYHSRTRKEELEKYLGLKFCSELKELLEGSDFVVLCVPFTAETKNLISSKELSYMKSTAILINVGRGGTVNHDDLTAALQNGIIKAAALDVTEPVSLPRDHPLLNMSNVIITPHIATYTASTQMKLHFTSLQHLKAGISGEELLYPVN
ncbi:hypothetical protein ACROYT_G009788 [Oculina patagonica]